MSDRPSLIPAIPLIQDRLDEVNRERKELLRLLKIARDHETREHEANARRTKTGTPGLLT